MTLFRREFLHLLVLNLFVCRSVGMTVTEMSSLYTHIFTNYDARMRPLIDQSAAATVGMSFRVFSINGFDEKSGTIELSMLVQLEWKEERISWDPADYSGTASLILSSSEIWHPKIYLYETASQFEDITNSSDELRLNSDGSIIWQIGKVVKATCSVDVTYFPFDSQACKLTFGNNLYIQTEVVLIATDSSISVETSSENGQWILSEKSKVSNDTLGPFITILKLNLFLERRVKFFVVYIIVPTVFLSILNILVFAMPKDSGERLSVATTMFLSFIVYMDIVNNNVPESSEPMSFFYFYLLFLVVYSSCIMLLCVISLRIHAKTSQVPLNLQSLIRLKDNLTCLKTGKKSKIYPDDKKTIMIETLQDVNVVEEFKKESNPELNDRNEYSTDEDNFLRSIGWTEVGELFDESCLIILGLSNIIFSCYTFDVIVNNNR